MHVTSNDSHFIIPGLASAHSHAFQRILRGRTQRVASEAKSFWSWRGLMYAMVERLDPDDIYDISRLAYAEMAMSGLTLIGEFHYLHHDLGGKPYGNRTETAEACIRAALDVGIRICLIRTAYRRGGFEQELAPAQQRFSDPALGPILSDTEALMSSFADNDKVSVALAAHSIRAVKIDEIGALHDFSVAHDLPFHMHICEQRRELDESRAEYGQTPVHLLAEHGILSKRFVGVHATHLDDAEIQLLGGTGSNLCVCRTTERDLGDGSPRISELLQAGAVLTVGADSHCCENAFEEIRAVEFDERARLEARHTTAEAPVLLQAGTYNGYKVCGQEDSAKLDFVHLDRRDPSLVGTSDDAAADAIILVRHHEPLTRSMWMGSKSSLEAGIGTGPRFGPVMSAACAVWTCSSKYCPPKCSIWIISGPYWR